MASVKQYVQGVVNAIGEVNTSLTQINAQDVPNKIRELKVQVGSKQLLGTYDGSSVEVTEAGVVDIGAMLDEGKLPLEVNVNVQSGGDDMLQARVDVQGNCNYLFQNYLGTTIDFIGKLNTSNSTAFVSTFQGCSNLIEAPMLDTSNATTLKSMFKSCSKLKSIPLYETSNVTDMNSMFESCKELETIPLLDTSNVTDMYRIFINCSSLKTIPKLNTSKVTTLYWAFGNCSSLETIPELDIRKVTNIQSCFGGCTNLITIEGLDLIGINNKSYLSGIFNNCTNLTNLTLKNIRFSIQIGSGTSWGHLLTLDSLISVCRECYKQSTSTLTMGTANLEKLANVYVRFVDTTITTIPTYSTGADIEVCESTDEGAMLITDYMSLKWWTLA